MAVEVVGTALLLGTQEMVVFPPPGMLVAVQLLAAVFAELVFCCSTVFPVVLAPTPLTTVERRLEPRRMARAPVLTSPTAPLTPPPSDEAYRRWAVAAGETLEVLTLALVVLVGSVEHR